MDYAERNGNQENTFTIVKSYSKDTSVGLLCNFFKNVWIHLSSRLIINSDAFADMWDGELNKRLGKKHKQGIIPIEILKINKGYTPETPSVITIDQATNLVTLCDPPTFINQL